MYRLTNPDHSKYWNTHWCHWYCSEGRASHPLLLDNGKPSQHPASHKLQWPDDTVHRFSWAGKMLLFSSIKIKCLLSWTHIHVLILQAACDCTPAEVMCFWHGRRIHSALRHRLITLLYKRTLIHLEVRRSHKCLKIAKAQLLESSSVPLAEAAWIYLSLESISSAPRLLML